MLYCMLNNMVEGYSMLKQEVRLTTILFFAFFINILHAEKQPKPATEFKLPITSTWSLTSNYIFRGITQTNNGGAIQGGITYSEPSTGIYGSVWGSNVKFPEDELNRSSAELEFDTTLGIANKIRENFSYNLYLTRYNYTQAASYDYNEFIADLQFYFLTGELAYSRDVYATGEPGTYFYIGINYDIPEKYAFGLRNVNLTGHVGRYDLPSNTTLYTSYTDYLIQLAKTFGNYQLSLAWTDTNGKFFGPAQWGDSKAVFRITANLS